MKVSPENFLPKEVHKPDPSLTHFPFKVGRIEYLGSDRLMYGVVDGNSDGNLTIAKLPSTVSVPIEEGETYDFVIEEQHLKFFDKETGLKTAPQPLSG